MEPFRVMERRKGVGRHQRAYMDLGVGEGSWKEWSKGDVKAGKKPHVLPLYVP